VLLRRKAEGRKLEDLITQIFKSKKVDDFIPFFDKQIKRPLLVENLS
tara:strand:- start:2427 stop:2567 length:141 start_codon:yes stop_codon:yes gene_type:complete